MGNWAHGNKLGHFIVQNFSNRNKSGVDKYLKIQDCKPFVIIQFPDQTYVNTVLKNKHVFKNGALIPEILYNSKLVPNFDQQNKWMKNE